MQSAKHIELIGKMAVDKVTGMKGAVSSICFDLYGCIQAALAQKVDKDGKIPEAHWFDVKRLTISDESRIMPLPDFDKGYIAEGMKGAAPKPLPGC